MRSPLTGRTDGLPRDLAPFPPTRPVARARALAAVAALLAVWVALVGIPNDTVGVALWLWLVALAWHADAPPARRWDFARDWWRPVLLLVVYWLLRGLADQTGVPVHVETPVRLDAWLGGGTVPTVRLQRELCGVPCDPDGAPRWWDVALTTVYASHFLLALVLAGVLWLRDRVVWLAWMRRLVVLNLCGLVVYALYPMAPPWMAADLGALPPVERISGRGWSELGLHRQSMVLLGMSNKVAAMPSLHAGTAFLVAFFALGRLRSRWRWLLLAYPLAMCVALVHGGEHYVVDTLAGAALALAVAVGCSAWERRTAARDSGRDSGRDSTDDSAHDSEGLSRGRPAPSAP